MSILCLALSCLKFLVHIFDLDLLFHNNKQDPPKVIPDVVEALIGAAHVDLGFDQGQNAALHVLDPIIRSISSMCSVSLSADFSLWSLKGILHPKQHLFEMTSGIVRVRAYKNDRFNRLGVSSLFVEDSKDLDEYVGVVTCKGLVISAVRCFDNLPY